MKPFRLALTVAVTLGALPLFAAEDPLQSFPPGKPGLRFIPSTPPPDTAANKLYPAAYIKAVGDVIRAFRARDWPQTLEFLDRADKIHPPTPVTLNTRAAIAIEEKKFEDGARLCQKALKLDPKFYPARFNLAEIELVQGRYAEARKAFEKFVRENPKDELARFRVFLTFLLEKNYDDARRSIDQIPFPGDTRIITRMRPGSSPTTAPPRGTNGWAAPTGSLARRDPKSLPTRSTNSAGSNVLRPIRPK